MHVHIAKARLQIMYAAPLRCDPSEKPTGARPSAEEHFKAGRNSRIKKASAKRGADAPNSP